MSFLERFARRSADVSGLMPLARLRRRLADLEPALEENARLEVDLLRQVADLERRVGDIAHSVAQQQAQPTDGEGR